MVDFAKLSREGYEKASPEERAWIDALRREREIDRARPRARVKALRKDCFTGKESEIEIVLVVRPSASRPDERWLFIEEGGSTGWESMPFDRIDEAIGEDKGWAACFGTEGRWDGLTVPVESLKAAREALKS